MLNIVVFCVFFFFNAETFLLMKELTSVGKPVVGSLDPTVTRMLSNTNRSHFIRT